VSHGAQCDRVGVATASPTTGTWSASSTSREARKSRAEWKDVRHATGLIAVLPATTSDTFQACS
jgi:hypothetical protein